MQRGMSLIELLVYIAILSVVVVVLSATFVSFVNIRAKTEAITSTDTALRYVSETLTRDVERASAVIAPVQGSGTSTTLMFGTSTVAYTLVDGAIMRTSNGITETLTGERVTVTTFEVRHTANEQPLRDNERYAGLQWSLGAEHAYGANEYRYNAARQGAASLRSLE